ncbi:hypothetical protein TWF696_005665 [Orbilia brochopaga]|uniref:Transcription factor domain-containing protein n=1 Tax=Orbilia brochopaga TaxID=3140254 RepID=A0AAV9V2Q0_9PEZI
MLQTPPEGSHPVLIARKLLMLGIYLQGFSTSNINELGNLSISYCDVMQRAVETAARLVTSNDKFFGAVETIECIMMESMYQNNAGNLRLAYLAIRRTLIMSQMVVLRRGYSSPALHVLEPSTRRRIDPERLWFRIVQSDRYLSLMLGLPQGTSDGDFAAAKQLENCTAMERLERMDCSAGGQIIQRSCVDIQDLKTVREIDQLLQNAAANMPPQWWLVPNLSTSAADGRDSGHAADVVRLMNQFTHYHLVQRLHLPYLLQPSISREAHSSMVTAIVASRELLSRFVSFRDSHAASSFCRGVDFLAFIANTALCLAHINARRHNSNHDILVVDNQDFLSFLAHQRPSDRGLMERVLEILERAAFVDVDAIAAKIARINRQLLMIEADASAGSSYVTSSSHTVNSDELECSGKIDDDEATLQIYIPYLGSIRFERCSSSGGTAIASLTVDPGTARAFESQTTENSQALTDGWDLQGVDRALFNSIFQFQDDQ